MGLVLMLLAVMLLSFSILGATVLTQPPVPQIEEMGGLVHMRSCDLKFRDLKELTT
ncbi:MAG TPA: hypothetical protein VFZ22_22015 [Pyrinomonadaceae bacterium]|nr:hypothetical protein [Pyrinomonadaceae bacterium]